MRSKILVSLATLTTAGVITVAGASVVNADSSTSTGNVAKSGIPRSTFKDDRLAAEAQVLNTTTANVQSAIKYKTLHTLISNAGLTRPSFRQKVKAQLTTDLENAGYSQDQVNLALQHKVIVRLRHKEHHQN